MENTLFAVFGFLVVVAVVSSLIFRRRPLGTRLRTVLSVLAVLMFGAALVREKGFSIGAVLLTLFTAFVLGSGVSYLRRAERERPPAE